VVSTDRGRTWSTLARLRSDVVGLDLADDRSARDARSAERSHRLRADNVCGDPSRGRVVHRRCLDLCTLTSHRIEERRGCAISTSDEPGTTHG
jgi:hypothetical protein